MHCRPEGLPPPEISLGSAAAPAPINIKKMIFTTDNTNLSLIIIPPTFLIKALFGFLIKL
jgi:hypothetical protein